MLANTATASESHIWVGAPFAVAISLQLASILSAWLASVKIPKLIENRLARDQQQAKLAVEQLRKVLQTAQELKTAMAAKQVDATKMASAVEQVEALEAAEKVEAKQLAKAMEAVERLNVANLPVAVKPKYVADYAIWAIDVSQAWATVAAPVAALALSSSISFDGAIGIVAYGLCMAAGVGLLIYTITRPSVPRYIKRLDPIPITPVTLAGLILNCVLLALLLQFPQAGS